MAADVGLVARAAQGDAHVLRPSERAIDLAIDVLPTPGGPTNRRIGPFAIARALASLASVIGRSSCVGAGDLRRRVFLGRLELGDRHLAGLLELLLHLLRAQLAHGEELEHAILHVRQAVVVLVEHFLRVTPD